MDKEETKQYQRKYRLARKKNRGKKLGCKHKAENASLTVRVTYEWEESLKSYIEEVIRCERRAWLAAAVNLLAFLPDQIQRDLAATQIDKFGENPPSPELRRKIALCLFRQAKTESKDEVVKQAVQRLLAS